MSKLEDIFALQVRAYKLPVPEREYRFHGSRRWRFDFAWVDLKIAVEIDGGTWVKGRHTRGKGFQNDCYKYNAASYLGWTILRGDTGMVKEGVLVAQLQELLKLRMEG